MSRSTPCVASVLGSPTSPYRAAVTSAPALSGASRRSNLFSERCERVRTSRIVNGLRSQCKPDVEANARLPGSTLRQRHTFDRGPGRGFGHPPRGVDELTQTIGRLVAVDDLDHRWLSLCCDQRL